MSAVASFTVFCNGLTADGRECPVDTPNAHLGERTAAEARAEAARQGWATAQPGGKDYCPECIGSGFKDAQNARERLRRRSIRERTR